MDHPDAQTHFQRVREWLSIINQFYHNGVFHVYVDCIWFVSNDVPGRVVELPWCVELYELLVSMPEAVVAGVEVDSEGTSDVDPLDRFRR
ncbi:hypothetical protein P5V15_001146 [Pogonomyrmex californicus]